MQLARAAFDALPDAVIADVFKQLGLRASWPLRRVCRRWRRVVEETEWASFDLRVRTKRIKHVSDGVSALFKKRKLRLSAGASVALRPELEVGASRDLELWDIVGAVGDVLAAISVTHRGHNQAQPREVVVEFLEGDADLFDEYACAVDDLFMQLYVLSVLAAYSYRLRDVGGTVSGLHSLSIGLSSRREALPGSDRRMHFPSSADGELGAALAPFRELRSLDLFFHNSAGIPPETAAIIAAACPLLRSITICPLIFAANEVLAALAPLAHLEELAVVWPSNCGLHDFNHGVAALACGAAGASLRKIAFVAEAGLHKDGGFPKRSADPPVEAPAEVFAGGLRALGLMPNLESIGPLIFKARELDPEEILALGCVASLREAHVCLYSALQDLEDDRSDPDFASGALRALAGALSRLPRLERLRLDLVATGSGHGPASCAARPADVVAVLASAGARRALTELRLVVCRPLSEAEAEAIVALPALRRLRIVVAYRAQSAPPLRPFEVLRRLRAEVAAEVRLQSPWGAPSPAFEGARAAIHLRFPGR
eukprot:tig00000147_g9479.t1